MAKCKKDVTPPLTHWSYVFLALTPQYALPCAFLLQSIVPSPGHSACLDWCQCCSHHRSHVVCYQSNTYHNWNLILKNHVIKCVWKVHLWSWVFMQFCRYFGWMTNSRIDPQITIYASTCLLIVIFWSMVSCQKGPTCHAYTWQIGPFWQDTLDMF